MHLPPADKYEVRLDFSATCHTTSDPAEALALLTKDGIVTAVRSCVGREVAARINGVLLNAREYRHYLDLTDGGAVRRRVEGTERLLARRSK